MALCPFAIAMPITGSVGDYIAAPFRIVHHTTEGATAERAFQAFRVGRSDPHFTVDHEHIWQHIDSGVAARSLRNDRVRTPETNRCGAVQIEVVGYAHVPKSAGTLLNLARLCRWIEAEHGIPRKWPNGYPKPAKDGKDPGHHERNAATWASQGGHYGHCHVPENTHWDPGYTAEEVAFLMAAEFGAGGHLITPSVPETMQDFLPSHDLEGFETTMPDHAESDQRHEH